jgi:hypothetical protein
MSAPSLASKEQAMRRVFTMLGHLHFNSLDQTSLAIKLELSFMTRHLLNSSL